tara:strand:- start:2522 stop:2974 length:453 start_codon:yes stop_codon:yes gene_type:complete
MFAMIKMLPVLLILGGASFGYHKIVVKEKDNRINQQQMDIASATQQNVALQTAAEINISTIKSMEKQMKAQAQAFADLTQKSNKLEQDKAQYLSIFKRHNLTKTARARPGYIEPKINSGTAKVFRQVEADSRELDEADDTSDELSYDTPK